MKKSSHDSRNFENKTLESFSKRTRVYSCLSLFALSLATSSHAASSTPDSDEGKTNAGVLQCLSLKDRKLGSNGEAVVTNISLDFLGGYCVVDAKMNDSDLKFQLHLPTKWNNNLAFLGGGGFDGSIPNLSTYPFFSPSIKSDGYAIMATNGGHDGGLIDSSFARDPRKLADYTSEATHRALPFGREIITTYYGKSADRSYFEGGSKGGQEGVIEAQRYPEDFDGIVARSSGSHAVGQFVNFSRVAQQLAKPNSKLGLPEQKLLSDAVFKACDEKDGLKDGIISNPIACKFKPEVLRCSWGGSDPWFHSCLSDEQISSVNVIASPLVTSSKNIHFEGYGFAGGESDISGGWGLFQWPLPLVNISGGQIFAESFIKDFVQNLVSPDDPGYIDPKTWSPEQSIPRLEELNKLFDTSNPDLSGFKKRGGKLVSLDGTIDSAVSFIDQTKYYDSVISTMGQSDADSVIEFFAAPGVGHVGMGGNGPYGVDLIKAVSTWVEQGTPPSKQNLTLVKKNLLGQITLERPLCKYPSYPKYDGKGPQEKASSFNCTAPDL
ncbi:tannase/feruloyl esterase family alpha/beta hydrolase [Variovorax sp. ZS18.2.2]|uniref:tannase/feruloyl esterase family alpha/beta hydrolase n=1 Tax=Variovorax sp. ZS18.2.2 TaxID=2971255 RepID=UPI002151C7BF|nr:tannase/feruloyl esterase family alpha/beta hydrolase [Variovorax sp. ZS18.2.2]MCR6475965.1 tannase/feruloyl esterase family alpha/beta hydrolase [Variovorax sp. ZS18.2.2]